MPATSQCSSHVSASGNQNITGHKPEEKNKTKHLSWVYVMSLCIPMVLSVRVRDSNHFVILFRNKLIPKMNNTVNGVQNHSAKFNILKLLNEARSFHNCILNCHKYCCPYTGICNVWSTLLWQNMNTFKTIDWTTAPHRFNADVHLMALPFYTIVTVQLMTHRNTLKWEKKQTSIAVLKWITKLLNKRFSALHWTQSMPSVSSLNTRETPLWSFGFCCDSNTTGRQSWWFFIRNVFPEWLCGVRGGGMVSADLALCFFFNHDIPQAVLGTQTDNMKVMKRSRSNIVSMCNWLCLKTEGRKIRGEMCLGCSRFRCNSP